MSNLLHTNHEVQRIPNPLYFCTDDADANSPHSISVLQPKSLMKLTKTTPITVSFKCSPLMFNSMNEMMIKRYLDRSSVIRLALYLFDAYMHQPDIIESDLYELVERLESLQPEGQMSFSEFCRY